MLHAGHFPVHARHFIAHALGHGDGVLARLLLDLNLDARLAVDAHERAPLLGGVLHLGDVAHVDRHALARHHHHVLDVLEALELTLGAEQEGGVALVDLAQRRVLVLAAQRLHHLGDRQVERGDLLLRQLDVDLPAQAAVHGHRGHAVHALEPRRQLVLRRFAQRHRVEVALDADLHDRLGARVELEDGGRLGVLRQAVAHAIDAGADFVGGLRQVGAVVEVEAHLAVALRRRGFDPRHARHGADRLFHRPGDQLLHLQRADAGVVGPHGELGLLELRHQIDREASQRDHAQQRDDAADHEHGDRPLNR